MYDDSQKAMVPVESDSPQATEQPRRVFRPGEVVHVKDVACRVVWITAKKITLQPIGLKAEIPEG